MSGEFEQLWFLDTLVLIRTSHEHGTDRISALEHRAPAGHSPPLHIHHSEDELFIVQSGQFHFRIGDEERELGAGDFLLAPKGVAHHFRVESADGGRWVTVTTHADFEMFVREVAQPAPRLELPPPPGPPTPEQKAHLGEVAGRYHIEIVGPPMH